MKKRICILILIIGAYSVATNLHAAHGIALNSSMKYPADFTHFSYADPQAQKGGTINRFRLGNFDSLNPFNLKGVEAYGLQQYLFEPLGVKSLDEPLSIYGLVAQDVTVATDGLSMTITIHPSAKFSNGSAIQARDIGYTIDYLKSDEVHPQYPYYYRDISGYEILSKDKIRINFSKKNQELPLITMELPVIPNDLYSPQKSPARAAGDVSEIPYGSGPYVIDHVVQGKVISYKQNPDYWAKDHPTRRFLFNFETITFKYYKDHTVALEAFKAGEFDVMLVNMAKQWARDLGGKKFERSELIKKKFPHENNAGMQGFVMNTRRELFQDRRVRQAMGLAFDFEWTNKSLFYGEYIRNSSFFSNTHLAATGLPQGLELHYLNENKDIIPEKVFTTPLAPPVAGSRKALRSNLKQAKQLLLSAGYTLKDGKLVNSKNEQVSFEILLILPTFERIIAPYVKNLGQLGIEVRYRTIDETLYTERLKKFDYDMVVVSYGQSLSPGNEQRNFWHSMSVDRLGSNNYAGIQSKAVDNLIEKIIYATNKEELTAACRALDRVLWYGYYIIPNWHLNSHRITYRNVFEMPATLPKYYSANQLIDTWWFKE